ncbi:MAG: rhodanese-like domain-containing protein [Candidatus Nanohaloarchaea archaeon]|nr:rhodanese-like domain-containing protein [Candidatus Nanohaloarchaea archaeon]
MKTISRGELKKKLDSGEDFHLVNVLSQDHFEQQHIPKSINIPLDQLEDEAPKKFDKGDEIVVYCASEECQASPKAAKKLSEMGFKKVKDYEGGVKDWKEAGLDMEGNDA